MSIKDILVHLTPEAASRPAGSVRYAISMADKLGAHFTGLVFAVDFTKPATFYGGATDEDIVEARERFRRPADEAAATFVRGAEHAGISYETVTEESLADGAPQIMNDYAKLRDLMICGNDQTGLLDGKTFGEYVLFASGRPVIVVPPGQDGPFACDRILVACLEEDGKHVEPQHFRLMMACAEICRACAHLMLINYPLYKRVCRECAEICELCAQNCDRVGDMPECAQACRRCAERCSQIAAYQ